MDKIARVRQKVKELQDEFISIQPKDCSLELIKSYAGYAYLDKVLSFLDTLSEEPSKSLEEAAEKGANEYYVDNGCSPFPNTEKASYISGFIAGAEWKESQMLKDAVEADVNTYKDPVLNCGWVEFVVDMPSAETDKFGQKVRIVVLKEEE